MLLRQQKNPIDAPEIVRRLGEAYSERSVRRWLKDMVEEGTISKYGAKRATKYAAKLAMSAQLSENYINKPTFERTPTTYHAEWLENYTPNQTFYLAPAVQAHLTKVGKRSINHDLAGTYARKIHNRLLVDLSYNSSRLEGNTYSLLETEKLLFEGQAGIDKLDEEKIMILNHKEAIRYLIDNAARLEITVNEICTLHYLLAEGLVQHQYAGKLRDYSVRIGSSVYSPLENQKQIESVLEMICNKARLIQNPFEQSFFLLVHIAYLQGFVDVNKRTSRLSANIPLIKHNYVPLSFNSVDTTEYITALLAIYELNNTALLEDIYIRSYLHTCELYDATIESVGFDEIRILYRQQRREMMRLVIINKLTGTALQNFIDSESQKLIPEKHQSLFKQKLIEDLREINLPRLVGLGVTEEEMLAWKKLN